MGWLFPKLEKFFPWLAERLFIQIFFTPAKYPYPDKELPYLEKAEKRNLSFKGRKVMSYKWGEGPSILCIHGWMGRATQFRKFVDVFTKEGYSVISFDAPAHGKSEGVKSHLMYFVEVAELLEKENRLAGIIGHSLGGVAGLHVAHRGGRVPKVIMIGSPTIADKIIEAFLKRLKASWKLGNYFKNYIKKTYGQPFDEYSAEHIIKEIKELPILLIYDKDDLEVPLFHGETIKELYPKAKMMVTEGLGHTRILRDDEVVRKTFEFISN